MRRADPITELRRAIDALPTATRRAMLDGVNANDIVMGAYTDNRGGVCPMLAAHRNGGRTSYLAFARAWDRLGTPSAARRATQRELRILVSQLEISLLEEDATDLGAAIDDHMASKARRASAAATPTSPDEITAARLTPRSGVRRLRPTRRSDAERALRRLEALQPS